jgi:hypothetical protein
MVLRFNHQQHGYGGHGNAVSLLQKINSHSIADFTIDYTATEDTAMPFPYPKNKFALDRRFHHRLHGYGGHGNAVSLPKK